MIPTIEELVVEIPIRIDVGNITRALAIYLTPFIKLGKAVAFHS